VGTRTCVVDGVKPFIFLLMKVSRQCCGTRSGENKNQLRGKLPCVAEGNLKGHLCRRRIFEEGHLIFNLENERTWKILINSFNLYGMGV
jgi:hypothetical protein